MAVEGRAGAPPSSEDAVLFGQLHPRTVDQPDQRNVQTAGQLRDAKLVFGLPGQPGPGENLVVEAGDHAPFPGDPGQAVHDAGGSLRVFGGIEQRVQGEKAPRVDQPPDSFPDGEKSLFVHDFRRRSRLPYSPRRFLDPVFFGLQLRPVPWVGADRGCGEERHFFKVTVHDVSPFPALSYVVVVRAFPVKENFLLSIE